MTSYDSFISRLKKDGDAGMSREDAKAFFNEEYKEIYQKEYASFIHTVNRFRKLIIHLFHHDRIDLKDESVKTMIELLDFAVTKVNSDPGNIELVIETHRALRDNIKITYDY